MGNIFGGYASIKWSSSKNWMEDKDAFLFLIRSNDQFVSKVCPKSFDQKSSDNLHALHHDPRFGPAFGAGYDILINDRCDHIGYNNECYTYLGSFSHRNELCGDGEH